MVPATRRATTPPWRRWSRPAMAAVVTVLVVALAPIRADAATRTGTEGPDVLIGTSSPDRIDGRGGADRISAGRGQDIVFGGAGNDRIRSEKNNDVVNGGPGDDFIDGGRDDDRLLGGAGDDSIQGGSGDDRIEGGPGDDRLQGQANTDIYTFRGDFGSDLVIDSSGNKDLLVFPDVDFADARIVRKGADNVVIITPNGQVEIADQVMKKCERTRNGEPNIEGVKFRDTDAQIATGGTVRLFKVRSIAKTNCGRTLGFLGCVGTNSNVCDDFVDPGR
ncbi:MAG: calcium-binding protein [Actinomycetota bacterium]